MSKDEAPAGESTQTETPSNEGSENPMPNQSPPERAEVPSGDTAPPSVPEGVDLEAPYGRSKVDGSPLKKRGRKAGGTNTTGDDEQRARLESVKQAPPRRPVITPVIPIVRDYDKVAKAAANLWFNVPQMFFGGEWAPDTQAGEHEAVKGAFKDYFESKDIGQIDPGVMLVIVLGGYTVSRVTKPTIQSRIGNAWQWIKSKTKR